MKKILLCMLVVVLALALVACGGDDTQTPDVTDAPQNDTEPSDTDVTDPGSDSSHTHSFVETVTLEPTCTSLGKKVMKCSCGEIDGDEFPLPFAPHNANEATCTEDSVCATCGKLLTEKYEHLFVDSVTVEATCTTDGVAKSTCYRCGTSTETVVAAGHDYDMTNITVSKGGVGSTCKKCGQTASFAEGKTLLKFDFENESELTAYPEFTKAGGTPVYANGSARMGGAVLFNYSPETITSVSKILVSFDFQMVDEGRTNRGESIFSFLATPTGGSTTYNWLVKYYEADHVISTADSGHSAANSVPAERGKWYNCTAIVDTVTRETNVYIDGVSIGTKQLPAHTADGKYQIRLYDAMPGNGTSNPMFDNLKIVEIK